MIDFPASPTVGQIFKTGNLTYKYDGSSWLSNPPNSAITDAPNDGLIYGRQSRAWVSLSGAQGFVKKSGDNMTGVLGLADGTVAAPGLAWTNEQGLGWFRPSASRINIAAQGATVTSLDASSATSTLFNVNPRTAGFTQMLLLNQPTSAANYSFLALGCGATGIGTITAAGVGTAPARSPLNLVSSTVSALDQMEIHADVGVSANLIIDKKAAAAASGILGKRAGVMRWQMQLGDGNAESSGNLGSDFAIYRYADDGSIIANPSLYINRSTGSTTLQTNTGGSGVTDQILTLQQNNAGGYSQFRMLHAGSGAAKIIRVGTDNALAIVNAGNTSVIASLTDGGVLNATVALTTQGNIQAPTYYVDINGTAATFYLNHGTPYRNLTFGNGYIWRWNENNGDIEWISNGVSYVMFRQGDHAVINWLGTAYKPGGGPWIDSSDIRIKENIEPYLTGLDAILGLEPVSYNFRKETGRDTTKRYIRLIAQDAMKHMPEIVTVAPGDAGPEGKGHFDDLHTLDEGPVLWALVNAVKTLNERLVALETP